MVGGEGVIEGATLGRDEPLGSIDGTKDGAAEKLGPKDGVLLGSAEGYCEIPACRFRSSNSFERSSIAASTRVVGLDD